MVLNQVEHTDGASERELTRSLLVGYGVQSSACRVRGHLDDAERRRAHSAARVCLGRPLLELRGQLKSCACALCGSVRRVQRFDPLELFF